MPDRPDIDMRRVLGGKLRKAFAPVTASQADFDANVTDLLARLDRAGADRSRPFRQVSSHR